jgi:hypothetical protein
MMKIVVANTYVCPHLLLEYSPGYQFTSNAEVETFAQTRYISVAHLSKSIGATTTIDQALGSILVSPLVRLFIPLKFCQPDLLVAYSGIQHEPLVNNSPLLAHETLQFKNGRILQ